MTDSQKQFFSEPPKEPVFMGGSASHTAAHRVFGSLRDAAEADTVGQVADNSSVTGRQEKTMDSKPRDNEHSAAPHCSLAGVGVPIGLTDRNGKPIHIGDTLEFDAEEWGSGNNVFTIVIANGEIEMLGGPSDMGSWCKIIRSWDE